MDIPSHYQIAAKLVMDTIAAASSNEGGFAASQCRGLNITATRTKTGRVTIRVGGQHMHRVDAAIGLVAACEQRGQEADAAAALFKQRHVPMRAAVSYCEGHAPDVTLSGRVLLQMNGTYYHVGAVPRGQKGRKANGKLVEPWAYTFKRAVVLSSSEALRDKDAAERLTAMTVEAGTILSIDGVLYKVVLGRDFINLVPVDNAN